MKIGIIQPLALLLLVLGTSCNPDKLVSTGIEKQIATNVPPEYIYDEENIVVVTVGTASPMPGKRAQTGTAIFVNGNFFMFDVGAGVVQKSENIGLPLDELDGIFLTHYHSDHVMDLPNMISRSWQFGRADDLNVYGPQGLNQLMNAVDGFLAIDNSYRLAHHGIEVMDTVYADGIANEFIIEQDTHQVIYDKDGIKITAFDVTHEPIEPAVGYKIEYKGKKVVISGDTKKNDLVSEMAMDCDLLLHEVMLMSFQKMLEEELREAGMNRNAAIIFDIQDYHTDTKEVAELARDAKVKKLVLNHLAPAPDNRTIKKLYMDELKAFEGPIYLADDGDVFIVNGKNE